MSKGMLCSGALAKIARPLKDLMEKLASTEGMMWFWALKKFLRKENPWALKLVRCIALEVGGISGPEIMERLDVWSRPVGLARDILPTLATLSSPTEILLGWITVRDLGFTKEPKSPQLFARIQKVGDLCSPEDGARLRMADKGQPAGDGGYFVPMEPTAGIDPWCSWYIVTHGSGVANLDMYSDAPNTPWPLNYVVVIRLTK